MKKSCLTFCVLLCTICCFANNENVCVLTNTGSSGQACSASSLGFVDPCSTVPFIVNYQIPAGFVIVAQYEWFVNGVSVKTTNTPSDIGLNWQIKSKSTTVFCKVTYKKGDGTLSEVYTSNSFTPDIKQLNFANDGIITTTPPPNFGCTTTTVSYSLNTFLCTGNFCSTTFNVIQYSITWQPPSGWTQTSISANGNNVSFLPDATSSGPLTATITLPCGFTDTRTFTIDRIVQKPTFTSSNNAICASPSNIAINSICGAIDYTYTIIGPSGITFTSNGLQSLTTTNINPSISLSGSPTSFTLKAKANYSGNVVSGEESVNLVYGTPKLLFSNGSEAFNLIGQRFDYSVNGPGNSFSVCPSEFLTFTPYVPSGLFQGLVTGHEWTVSGSYSSLGFLNQENLSISAAATHPSNFQFSYRYQNQCGWSPLHYGQTGTRNCDGGEEPFRIGSESLDFSISPNPAKNYATLQLTGINNSFEVRLFNLMTTKLESFQRFEKGQTQVRLSLGNLQNGTYVVQITSNGVTKSKQLKVLR